MEIFMKNKHSIYSIITLCCLLFFSLNCGDSSGNEGNNTGDTEAPVAELLNTPPSITNSDEIDITVAGADVVIYSYNLDDSGWSSSLDINTHITESGLSDGAHTLAVVGCDSAGGCQNEQSATVCEWEVDTAAPVGTFTINNNNDTTHLYWVALNINITGATKMRFQNEGEEWSEWEPYANLRKWLISEQTDNKHIFIQTMDLAGNLFESDDEIVFESKLVSSDAEAGDFFAGNAVSFTSSGDKLIAGACNDDDKGTDSGSVYIYAWNSDEEKITASNGGANHQFGHSVSVSSDGNTFIAGAPGHNSAYIYHKNGTSWSETILTPSVSCTYYGYRVAVSGDGNTAIVGAQAANLIHIYRKNNDTWDAINAAVTGINFSWSTSITNDGNTALVGDYNARMLYVLNWNVDEWVCTKIGPSSNTLGWSVDISDDGKTLLAGAPGVDSAFIYEWITDAWSSTATFTGTSTTNFGRRVSLSSDGLTAIVGAPGENRAYVYQWNDTSWDKTELTASDAVSGDEFGFFVEISADGLNIAVGSHSDDSQKGSAYIYRWNGTEWID